MVKIIRKTDFFAIGIFIVLAVALIFIFFTGGADTYGARIIILSEDGEIYNLSLAEMEGESHEIYTDRGKNVISVSNGRVYMSRADCHGGDCVRWPPLTNTFQRIVCLPNRVTIMLEIADEPEGPSIDIMITL
ncbi:MAG: NusG domain II-containing protein [Defluviitaleaceae bacterium]|nr:NusG domain II-containing protein [Defluviitaleaceae bacterium]